MQIAFENLGGSGWTGGDIYLSNLLQSLDLLDASERPNCNLLGERNFLVSGRTRDSVQTLELPSRVSGRSLPRRLLNILSRVTNEKVQFRSPLGRFLSQNNVDVLFGMNSYGPRFGPSLVGWIPDFQHVHLPEMYSAEIRGYRDGQFARMAKYAQRVVLSSQDALGDFVRLFSEHSAKARVMSFVNNIPDKAFESDPKWVCGRYDLPEKFFYLPNQFWKHKNHKIVLEALSIAKQAKAEICVVCTGNTNDAFNPGFFGEMLAEVAARGLRDSFIILGMVPRDHVFSLMRQSVRVLQPSRFEGWSTSVEEAKSMERG